jgi:hypothetical protein
MEDSIELGLYARPIDRGLWRRTHSPWVQRHDPRARCPQVGRELGHARRSPSATCVSSIEAGPKRHVCAPSRQPKRHVCAVSVPSTEAGPKRHVCASGRQPKCHVHAGVCPAHRQQLKRHVSPHDFSSIVIIIF